MTKFVKLALLPIVFLITACSDGPGPLEGTWQMSGLVPVTVIYRDGQEETMGIISNVKYEHEGNDVLITYLDGMAEGTTVRVSMTGPDSANLGFGKLTRVK